MALKVLEMSVTCIIRMKIYEIEKIDYATFIKVAQLGFLPYGYV